MRVLVMFGSAADDPIALVVVAVAVIWIRDT